MFKSSLKSLHKWNPVNNCVVLIWILLTILCPANVKVLIGKYIKWLYLLILSVFAFWLLSTIDILKFMHILKSMHVMKHMSSMAVLCMVLVVHVYLLSRIIIMCNFFYICCYYFVNCTFHQISPMVDNYGSFDFTPLKYVWKYYGSLLLSIPESSYLLVIYYS